MMNNSVTSAKRQRYDKYYMALAECTSRMSFDSHTKVGTIIVKDGTIISHGWNGTPSGFPNECKDQDGHTLPSVIHSEVNALYKLARSSGNAVGATLYTTHAPCNNCSLAILQSGISRVVYHNHRDDNGLSILKELEISVA